MQISRRTFIHDSIAVLAGLYFPTQLNCSALPTLETARKGNDEERQAYLDRIAQRVPVENVVYDADGRKAAEDVVLQQKLYNPLLLDGISKEEVMALEQLEKKTIFSVTITTAATPFAFHAFGRGRNQSIYVLANLFMDRYESQESGIRSVNAKGPVKLNHLFVCNTDSDVVSVLRHERMHQQDIKDGFLVDDIVFGHHDFLSLTTRDLTPFMSYFEARGYITQLQYPEEMNSYLFSVTGAQAKGLVENCKVPIENTKLRNMIKKDTPRLESILYSFPIDWQALDTPLLIIK